jgi:hypothetical protein
MHVARQHFVSVGTQRVRRWQAFVYLVCAILHSSDFMLTIPATDTPGSTLAFGIVGDHLMLRHVYFPSLPNHSLASHHPIGNFGRRVAMILKKWSSKSGDLPRGAFV